MFASTLPITPRENALFTTILSPFVADLIARFFSGKMVLAQNVLGMRFRDFSDDKVEEIASSYRGRVASLGIRPDLVWSERSLGYLDFLDGLMGKFFQAGIIREELLVVVRCLCGAVEQLEELPIRPDGGKVLMIESGKVRCKLCREKLRPVETRALLFQLPLEYTSIPTSSEWAEREQLELSKCFLGNRLLISRERRENIQFPIGGQLYGLDVDFVWSFFAGYIAEVLSDDDAWLVTSPKTLRQALQCAWFAKFARPSINVRIAVNPLMNISQGRILSPKTTLEEFVGLGRVPSLRFFLASALEWGRKEMVVPAGELYWIEHSVYPKSFHQIKSSSEAEYSNDSFFDGVNASIVKSLVRGLRKGAALTFREARLRQLLQSGA